MAKVKISRPPSPYPSLLFHLIRLAQMLSSIIVMSFLGFFVHYLRQDHYYVPWTFIVLLAVSSWTNLSVLVTAFFYHYRTLKPRLSSYINTFLTVLWAMGFAMLTWNLSGTLSNKCDIANWEHDTGIMVCRIYKALEAFAVLGMLFTACSLALDFHVLRLSRSRGVYNPMDHLDAKRPSGLLGVGARHGHHQRGLSTGEELSPPLRTGASSNNDRAEHDGATLARGYREPSLEFPEYSHEVKRPYKVTRQMEAQNFGYAAPVEQTSYGGASSRVLDKQFDEQGS